VKLSLILRAEHKLKVSENRVQREMFAPKRDELRGWRKLHNEELHNCYSSPSVGRTCGTHERGERCI
jgi:hypothetical protein